jgi:hypothetical protein
VRSCLSPVLYVLPRKSASFHRRDKTCAGGPQCAMFAAASRTEGQGAPDQGRGKSVRHRVKRTQVGLRSPAHVHRCRQDSPPLALFPSVTASPSARVAGKCAKYALEASRQTSGRRKIWRWRRRGGAGRLVCEPFRCWSQTRQERETRRNAEGVRPVALLKVVAKC